MRLQLSAKQLFLVIALMISAVMPTVSLCSDVATMSDVVLTGMQDNRERLRQGVLRATGHAMTIGPSGERVEGPLKLLIAFDVDKALLRFDQERPVQVIVAEGNDGVSLADVVKLNEQPGNAKVTQKSNAYFRIPGRSVHFEPASHEVEIRTENAKAAVRPFDVRATGILLKQQYSEGLTFENVLGALRKFPPSEAMEEGEGVYRIQWEMFSGQQRRTIWIDSNKGFSPIRMEVRDRRVAVGKRNERDGWPDPYLVNNASWVQKNGIWIPRTFQIEWRLPAPPKAHGTGGNESIYGYDYTFAWESVNTQVPDSFFTIDNLGCPRGTMVVNYLGASPIVERVIGAADSPLLGPISGYTSPPNQLHQSGSMRFVFIALNVAIILILLTLLLRRSVLSRRG